MRLRSISGAIRTSNAIAGTLTCNTTSGAIVLSGAFNRIDIDSISGRVELDNSAPSCTVRVNTTSGRIELSGLFDSVRIGSVSGGVSVKSAIVPSVLNINTTSSGITIAVPNEGVITVSHSSVSGRLNSDIPVIMQSSNAQFRLSTVSGGITITEY
jgi:DUF4097 and DUF4098 domain-containing protein YvlB